MAYGLDLLRTLPAHLLDEISEADWAQEKGREQSCSLVGEFLAQQADFKQLIDQLTQPEGSPLQKYLDGADDWKKKGNEAFKIGAWQKAVECYTKALQYAPDDGGLLAPLFSNRAAALEKLEETAAALVDCSRAIEADPQFSKAWYRRGKAKAARGDLSGSIIDFEKALRIENGENVSAPHPNRGGSAPAGIGRTGEAAVLSSSGGGEALAGSRGTILSGAQEAGKGKAVSGSAKQIASELERVRALLLEIDTAGGVLTRDSNGGNSKQVETRHVKDGQEGASIEMEIAQVGGSALCAGVKVFHQQGKGRGLQATESFRAGDPVISEAPYAAVLLKGQGASHCHHCFGGLLWNPLPCRGCAGPLFCGETCRDAALGRSGGALELSANGNGVESNPVNGGPSAGSYHADKPARTSSDERNCTQSREEVDGSKGASVWKVTESERGGGGTFWWHAHECGGASWAAVLPPDVVLALRMLARLQRGQSEAVKELPPGSGVDSAVPSLCHHLDRVPQEERLALLVHACTAAWCSQSSHLKTTPADVLLAIGQLRANVMAVNEVHWDEKRPLEQSESPFTNGGSSLGHGAKVEAQESRSVSRAQKLDSKERVSRMGERGELQGEEQVRVGAKHTSRVDPSNSAAGLSSTFEQVQLGQGLYPTASLLNHSCDPSTAVSFVGNKLVVRAVQGVKVGDELTLSYGPQKGEKRMAERRKWLWERYAFMCNCTACTGDQASDVVMTGFQCPQTKCGGVVPQYSATGRFSFSSSRDTLPAATASAQAVDAAHVTTSLPDTAAPGGVIDTSGKGRLESQSGGGEGVNEGVCSDCHLDAPDVVCEECKGRLLCLECDSHVHQPRSKRRGGHVRKRLWGASIGGKPGVVKRFEGLVVHSRLDLGSGLPKDDSLATNRTNGTLKNAREVAPGDLAKSKGVANVTTVEPSRATESVPSPKTSGSRGPPQTAGTKSYLRLQMSLLERSILNRIETQSSALEPPGGSADNGAVLRVERGRCTLCGAEMDVSDANARMEAAWAGTQGRMPYLEAAERALESMRSVLHPLNRKVAEYEDHVAQACAQSGRFAEAHDHCCRSLKILEHHYPRGSLPLAHEYSKLSSIAKAAGKLEEAIEMSQKAGDILAAHYGPRYRQQDYDNVGPG